MLHLEDLRAVEEVEVGPFTIRVTIFNKTSETPGMDITAPPGVSRMDWMDSKDSPTALVSLASSGGVSQPRGALIKVSVSSTDLPPHPQ